MIGQGQNDAVNVSGGLDVWGVISGLLIVSEEHLGTDSGNTGTAAPAAVALP